MSFVPESTRRNHLSSENTVDHQRPIFEIAGKNWPNFQFAVTSHDPNPNISNDSEVEGWQKFVHPEGYTYFYHREDRIVTENNIFDSRIRKILTEKGKLILDAVKPQATEKALNNDLYLDLDPTDLETCRYYMVDHTYQTIVWGLEEIARNCVFLLPSTANLEIPTPWNTRPGYPELGDGNKEGTSVGSFERDHDRGPGYSLDTSRMQRLLRRYSIWMPKRCISFTCDVSQSLCGKVILGELVVPTRDPGTERYYRSPSGARRRRTIFTFAGGVIALSLLDRRYCSKARRELNNLSFEGQRDCPSAHKLASRTYDTTKRWGISLYQSISGIRMETSIFMPGSYCRIMDWITSAILISWYEGKSRRRTKRRTRRRSFIQLQRGWVLPAEGMSDSRSALGCPTLHPAYEFLGSMSDIRLQPRSRRYSVCHRNRLEAPLSRTITALGFSHGENLDVGHVKRPTSTRPSDNTPRRAGPAPPRTPSSRQRPPITFQPRDSDDETDFEQPPAPQRPIHTTFASDNPFQISAADAVAKVSSLVKEAANLLWRIPEDFVFADDTKASNEYVPVVLSEIETLSWRQVPARVHPRVYPFGQYSLEALDDTRQAVDFIETRVASHDRTEPPTKSPTLSTDPKVFTLLEAISVRLQSLEGLVPSPPKARTASYAAAASSIRPQPPPPPPIPKLAPSPTQRHHPCRLVFQLTDPPDPRNRLPPLEVCERINQGLVGAGAPDALRVVAARWNNKGNCIILVHEDQKATDLVPYAEHFAHHICGLSKWEAIPDQAWTRVLVHGVDTGRMSSTGQTLGFDK
ncbi:hypothetical protein SISNIDRAFT_468120 [Sistotremastrum niveocremeum HHB9708]|uniref:WW domain-containing protein n=1 Tax=Sistotremastrum niveocremeum HHB9708 TaxID=1314777 RepID=A0A164RTM9_9AGAM|nr:hypothetical protein SISNIDRAFT_468120 [Sistotremastrum niveocremeum HHB9708]